MAPPLNRTAIVLDLAAFLGVSAFCIATQAPLIQQDILKRSQDALLTHRIPIRGMSVDGRDIVLSGAPESAVMTSRARMVVEQVPGVRAVTTKVVSGTQYGSLDRRGGQAGFDNSVLEPATLAQQREVQDQIDRILDAQSITFKPDTATLTPESELLLDKIVNYLTEAPNLTCEVRGYDSHPWEARQNWVLALQRALATEDYLESRGLADWRMSAHAFQIGEGTEGRRTDRVVDLVVKAR